MKVAVHGYGYWGPNIARVFRAAGCLVEVIDPSEARKEAAAQQGFTVVAAPTPGTDISAICTPPHMHEKLIRQELEAGRHVWTEKPVAFTAKGASTLAALAASRGLILYMDHTFTFAPVVQKLASVVSGRKFNHVQGVRAHLVEPREGATVLGDLLPHDLSILDACGLRVWRVMARTSLVEAEVQLDFAGEGTASLYFSWVSAMKLRRMTMYGLRWTVTYDHLNPHTPIQLFEADGEADPEVYRYGQITTPTIPPGEPLMRGVQQFCAAIAEKGQGNIAAALRVERLVHATERAAAIAPGQWLEID